MSPNPCTFPVQDHQRDAYSPAGQVKGTPKPTFGELIEGVHPAARLPQTIQTHLMEANLDTTLHQRVMMGLKERMGRNFFKATEILAEAAKHRDTLLFPRVIQTWEFIRRYLSDSNRLNWGTEPACRASIQDVQAAVEDCGIGTTMQSAEAWAALVALMNKPDKKQKECLKRLKTANAATFSDFIIPTPKMCDEVSYDEEK